MDFLLFILISILSISLLLSLFTFNSQMSANDIINNMGIGWNLGNAFDTFNESKKLENPDDQILSSNNIPPTKDMIKLIKKAGFKTIRFPVTWMNYMDDNGNVNSKWMSRVKEVVNWIIDSNMYCILNVHHDGGSGNWLSEGLTAKDKYIYLWNQIATEFKIYDEHLIFESMNQFDFEDNYENNTIFILSQAFVDTIRNSEGYNKVRLLLISDAQADLELICSPDYKMPIDPINKIAISIHYYAPTQFTLERDDNPWTWVDDVGIIHEVKPMTTWGIESDYNDMISNFETIKKFFIDKGIPVVLSEVSVLTEQKKEIESIREYLFALFSLSSDYGIVSCLWDTSNNMTAEFNFYDRKSNKWYDEIIKNNFKKISRGKQIRPKDYYIISNLKTVKNADPDGHFNINFGKKKIVKIIFNAFINTKDLYSAGFGIVSSDKNGNWVGESISASSGKRQYDGSSTFSIDASKKDFNTYLQLQKWWGHDNIDVNYLSLELDENDVSLDYVSYKKDLLI